MWSVGFLRTGCAWEAVLLLKTIVVLCLREVSIDLVVCPSPPSVFHCFKVFSVIPQEELTRFYDVMKSLGGYMKVQSQKKWQQVVKMCDFAQTTSSSYSTRNKYESYLLPLEEHKLLMEAVGQGPDGEDGVEKGVKGLGDLCSYYFDQVDSNAAKKNLCEPVQEMLQHSREAVVKLVSYLEDEKSSLCARTLNILRCTVSRVLHELVGDALAKNEKAMRSLVALFNARRNSNSAADATISVTLLAVASKGVKENNEMVDDLVDVFQFYCESDLAHPVLSRTFLSRLRTRAPLFLLARLKVAPIAQVLHLHKESQRSQIVMSLLRLMTAIFNAYLKCQRPREGTDWNLVSSQISEFIKSSSSLNTPALTCLNALREYKSDVAGVSQYEAMIADMSEDVEENSSEERAKMDGKRERRTTVSTAAVSLIPMTKKKIKISSEDDEDDDDLLDLLQGDLDAMEESDPNEDSEEKKKRKKRERERIRRLRLKNEKEERARIATERRIARSVLQPRRPRKPVARLDGMQALSQDESSEFEEGRGAHLAGNNSNPSLHALSISSSRLPKRSKPGRPSKVRKRVFVCFAF